MAEDSKDTAGDELIAIDMNKVVSFHYRLSDVDEAGTRGKEMEQSFDGDPLYYLHGFHNVVVGLERALEGKFSGDSVEIVLQPDDAYGQRKAEGLKRIPIKHLRLPKGVKKLQPGTIAGIETKQGTQRVLVIKAGKFNADVDFNHPYAGRALHYEIEVLDVRDASPEEIAHGHVHGQGGHHH